jgi:hypothetical protein
MYKNGVISEIKKREMSLVLMKFYLRRVRLDNEQRILDGHYIRLTENFWRRQEKVK